MIVETGVYNVKGYPYKSQGLTLYSYEFPLRLGNLTPSFPFISALSLLLITLHLRADKCHSRKSFRHYYYSYLNIITE